MNLQRLFIIFSTNQFPSTITTNNIDCGQMAALTRWTSCCSVLTCEPATSLRLTSSSLAWKERKSTAWTMCFHTTLNDGAKLVRRFAWEEVLYTFLYWNPCITLQWYSCWSWKQHRSIYVLWTV